MDTSKDNAVLRVKVQRHSASLEPPEHHVVAAPAASFLSWPSTSKSSQESTVKRKLDGFRNPWPSWHKPTSAEAWNSLQWGQEPPDPCIDLAASHLEPLPASTKAPVFHKKPTFGDINNWPDSSGAKATRLLSVEKPDFSFPSCQSKVTWLGHAGILVQLPPLRDTSGRPVRCLFDPMFSMRCSPSQTIGPVRSYPPPCDMEALPPIDAVFISHNHYDHLDYDTIMAIWKNSQQTVRFFVPLGNGQWFIDSGIPAARVTELDWWESAQLTDPVSESASLKIWCTPSQHGSGRPEVGVNTALWSSWFLESQQPGEDPYRVFFAGDTGYQFHDSPSWPPSPSQSESEQEKHSNDAKFPPCPAFAKIRQRFGPPNLLLLPVSVGATFAYLRSLVYLPDWLSPIPRHSPGVTGANHMPAWDAVRVLNAMRGGEGGRADAKGSSPTVAIAMHWGTFVTDPIEVLRTLGQLEWACQKQGVRFARHLDDSSGTEEKPWFLALNHGQSICI
ncbi:beta-lactamase superfamily domain-containing protein [Lasiosphaeria hispida]|uniref:Beta-lactamase superfamily domain-containing protein n=1 Tax=Lasiosphaeria hispida TaxID=260671 RepID=A0AAJ0HFF7_9PEZI|nr:beta-lactamase superfamily domain-containing protein [Lasiosphaeria hispida]